MNKSYTWAVVTLGVVAIAVMLLRAATLNRETRDFAERNERGLVALQDSLKRVQADIATAKETAQGLGEYMTTVQLHGESFGLPPKLQIGIWQNTNLMN